MIFFSLYSFYLLILYYKDIPIGGTFNIVANKRVGIIFYNMINYKYDHYNPATYQIYETIKWGQKIGLKYLDFGVSQFISRLIGGN